MMNGEIGVGAILHHEKFTFEDGTYKNKYLVVIGAKQNQDYLVAVTTSKQWRRGRTQGCSHRPHTYFFLPKEEENFFPKDTWIVLHDARPMSRAEMIKKGLTAIVTIKGNLTKERTAEIRDCVGKSRDIEKKYKLLL